MTATLRSPGATFANALPDQCRVLTTTTCANHDKRCAAGLASQRIFSQIRIAFRIPPERPTPNFAPTYNLAPTDPIPIVRYDAKAGERSLDVARWWLVPWFWKKEI